jgi:hypothetical protein
MIMREALHVVLPLSLLLPTGLPAAMGIPVSSVLRNPFFLPEEEEALLPKSIPIPSPEEIKEEPPLNLILQATFISGKEKIALINGQIVKEGEQVEDKTVVSIEKNRVVVKGIGTAPLVLPAVVSEEIEQ